MERRIFYVQKQITKNIKKILKSKNIIEKEYINYLVINATINKKRIKCILDEEAKKRLTLKEIAIIAKGLNVDVGVLFKDIV